MNHSFNPFENYKSKGIVPLPSILDIVEFLDL